ncbi:MAG: elongation factor G, partial [Victivallales bacterium]|nr:elongation factor G [Victivallales bacterium]
CPVEKIRNFVLAGHAGSGKTSLADLILFKGGAVGRRGSVDANTSVSDYRPEEQDKKSSIYTSLLHTAWKDGHFFFADTPGNTDFCGEAMNAINMCDMMILVIDAISGIGPGTIRAWNQARDRQMPRMIFINGCDRDQVNIEGTLENVVNSYGKTVCIPCTIPDGSAATFKGVHSVLAEDAPAEAEDYKSALMDAIAESDEDLMAKYLDTLELSPEEIATGFKKAVLSGTLVPIFFGSANKDLGVAELADAILTFGPSPLENIPMNIEEGELDRASSTAVGYVFKSVNDSFIGQMNYIRILSGTFKSDSELTNVTKNGKERIGNLLQIQGKDQATIEEAGPGEFIAIAKLKNTGLNDVLASGDVPVKFGPVKYPQSTTFYAVSAVAKGEEDKLGAGLKRLQDEDPTIVIDRNPETKQTIVSCMGDQYMNLMVARLKKDFKVEVALDTPRIAYRETINGTGTAQFRHKKQSGGHGQFAEVHLRLEPYTPEEGGEDFAFANEVVGGNIPKNYIPAVEKGVGETRLVGPLSRSKVINFKAVVYDGKYHDVDSSEMAFKIATRGAFRAAMANAKPMLLEPIMTLKIVFPEEYMGAISGDLNSRRGRILGMEHQEGMQVLNAEVPLAEVYSYPTQLRSMTHGRGFFEMTFNRYDPVPAQLTAQIQAEAAKLDEEEED